MKTSKLISSVFFILIFCSFSTAGFSQNLLQGEPDRDLELRAGQAAERWKKELAMTAKQTDLLERKLVEFGMKKKQVLQSKMREEVKVRKLAELQILQDQDIRDILTKPQYERYILLSRGPVKDQEEEN